MEYMQVSDIAVALVLASLLLLVGRFIRQGVKPLHKYYVPTSVIAGTLGLLLGPQVLGAIVEHFSDEEGRVPFGNGIWAESTLGAWSELPAVLISLVFAGLFVGKAIPKISTIWKRAGPMVAHGQTLAWGQYVVGLTLAVALLAPVWEVDTMSGALIEIGFEGGHGTAAGLAESFSELGFENGAELALGLATVGVIAGVLIGTLLINWGVARGHIDSPHRDSDDDEDTKTEGEILGEPQEKPSPPDHSVDTLSIHLALIAASIGVGWLILQAIQWFERTALEPLGWPELATHLPLFPFAMIGGVLVQLAAMRTGIDKYINRALINRISGTSLDILIIAALATLSLSAIGEHIWVFTILAVAGIGWNLFAFFVLAPIMFPKDWVPGGLANFGQGIGMAVIGLLLVRLSDPEGKTDAAEAFGYKQLLFAPIVGGGIFTAASLPLIAQFGAIPVLIGVTILMFGWLFFGIRMKKQYEE